MSSLLKERDKCTRTGVRFGGNVTRMPKIFLVLLRDVEGLGGGELVILMQWKVKSGKLFRYYSRVPVVNLLTLYF